MLLLDELIVAAKGGIKSAFTRTGQQDEARYGSALLTSNGNIYSSDQYYSDTLSLTLHAEQAAIVHAAAHGEYAIVAIITLGNQAAYQMSGGLIYPCHICKQLLWESYLRSGQDTEIYIFDSGDRFIERHLLTEIINLPWPQKKIVNPKFGVKTED